MIKSFLGADPIDEWRPKSLALRWGGGGDVGSDSGNFASGDTSGGWGGDFGGGYGGGSDAWSGGDSWSSADSFGGGGFDSGAFGDQGGFDNAASWSSYNGADAPFGASYTSPGESLFGGGGFDASNFVNFNEGQSFPGYYDTSPSVISFNESNPWGGALSDISNTLTGGFAGGPAGWQGEFGAYGPMSGASMGYANYAGNVTAPGLVGGFMDAGPFGTFQGPYDNDLIPTTADLNQGVLAPDDLTSSTQYNQTLGELGGQYGRNADALSQLANGMTTYYGQAYGPDMMDAQALGDQGRAGPLNQVSNVEGKGDFLGGYGRGGLDFGSTFGANFNPSNITPALDYVASRGDLSPTNDLMAASPFGPTNEFSGQPSLGNENATPGKGDLFGGPQQAADLDAAHNANFTPGYQTTPGWLDAMMSPQAGIPGLSGLPASMTGQAFQGQPGWAAPGLTAGLPADMFSNQQTARGDNFNGRFGDNWSPATQWTSDMYLGQEGKGDRGPLYDPAAAREALNEEGRGMLTEAFNSKAGRGILADQREMQDTRLAPWEMRAADLSFENQNMGRPNSYPTLAEFLGPGRGQSQNIYAPERGTMPLQVTVPGRVSESSRGVSTPFGGGAQQGGRGIQGQMDALLAQARTAPTQAARIAALDALNGLISANYGRGPFGSVGRGPYGGDPDPFIAAMLRMGR